MVQPCPQQSEACANPYPLPVVVENIPADLTALPRWVCWVVGECRPNGRVPKIPVHPRTGRPVDYTDPGALVVFDDALAAYRRGDADGVGFSFPPDGPFVG